MRRVSVAVLVCLLVAITTGGTPAYAQSFQGGVRGTLRDAQGVIPGVTILLINAATQAVRETITNGAGEYSFPAVDPTLYTLKAEVPGFRPYENKRVQIG